MKQRLNDILCGLLLCLFVNFVFSNTVFMHTHYGADGRQITHSHPYLPAGPTHSHTGNALDSIASFNLAVASMMAGESPEIDICRTGSIIIKIRCNRAALKALTLGYTRRGPPIAA